MKRKSNQSNSKAGSSALTELRAVLAERGGNYGKFLTQADLAQGLKNMCGKHMLVHSVSMTSIEREGMDMILHKLSRACNGNPHFADTWRDIAGYATLVADDLESANG